MNEIAARVPPSALTDIASNQPDPESLNDDVRAAFGAAFDRCLTPELAKEFKSRFGV